MSDDALVEAAQAGDQRALEALLRRHHDRLYTLCHRLCAGADADDACQEALIAIVRGLRSFDRRSSFSTWSYRVATNACFDELRRRRRRPVPSSDFDGGSGQLPPTAVDATERVDARLDIDAALGALPEEFRVAVVLRDLCELPYTEIAETLGVPVGTVRSRIARGRAALIAGHVPSGNRRPPAERPSP